MNDTIEQPTSFRKELVEGLGNEAGKTIYKHLTQMEKYTQFDLNYMELKQLVDTMYSKIYESLYKERYGETIATELLLEKEHFDEENKKEIEADNIERKKREEKKKKND